MDDRELRNLVRSLVEKELAAPVSSPSPSPSASPAAVVPRAPLPRPPKPANPADAALAKRVAFWLQAKVPLPPSLGAWRRAGDRAFYLSRTPARLGVGRAGTRYRTETVLAFLRDHAAARDAVTSVVDPKVAQQLGLVSIDSAARDKREFLTRPDLGRRLSESARTVVMQKGTRQPQVQIVAADGLSATALTVNLPLVLPALVAELSRAGVRLGTPFLVNNGRVASGDEVGSLLDAEVVCLLVGERPGLKTAESMGAYVTYRRVQGFNESMRSVISNIHKDGLPPAEGAKQVAALCLKALAEKRTGVEKQG